MRSWPPFIPDLLYHFVFQPQVSDFVREASRSLRLFTLTPLISDMADNARAKSDAGRTACPFQYAIDNWFFSFIIQY